MISSERSSSARQRASIVVIVRDHPLGQVDIALDERRDRIPRHLDHETADLDDLGLRGLQFLAIAFSHDL